jgi:hypothetical protein
MRKVKVLLAAGMFVVTATAAMAAGNIQITEWMYKGSGTGKGEFVEITNMGNAAVDMTGWSYADTSAKAGDVSLSAFGILQVGQCAILTDDTEANFRANWGLSASVRIIGGNAKDNLGNGDQIHIYDNTSTQVDSLIFGSTPSTMSVSCTIPFADLGLTNASTGWATAFVGDAYGSWSNGNDNGGVANPGIYYSAPSVPEPGSMTALFGGLLGLVGIIRRRK